MKDKTAHKNLRNFDKYADVQEGPYQFLRTRMSSDNSSLANKVGLSFPFKNSLKILQIQQANPQVKYKSPDPRDSNSLSGNKPFAVLDEESKGEAGSEDINSSERDRRIEEEVKKSIQSKPYSYFLDQKVRHKSVISQSKNRVEPKGNNT